MSNVKQTTLFQSWGTAAPSYSQCQPQLRQPGSSKSSTTRPRKNSKTHAALNKQLPLNNQLFVKPSASGVIDLCDDSDNDADLLAALEESLKYVDQGANAACSSRYTDLEKETMINASLGARKECQSVAGVSNASAKDSEKRNQSASEYLFPSSELPGTNSMNAVEVEDLPGFDVEAGRIWIYPTNYPVREYQLQIVRQALTRNTMVTLPTGLGKTFIAAVVMFNFYRWYPTSKIVFMAPTKPLVAQQITACHSIMGIPMEDTAEMTGAMQPTERTRAWRDKRLFYLTPQVISNDLSRNVCPAESVKCLVIDEAHKALGNHSYCQVIRELVRVTTQFRVVALSATPGSDIKAVQQVMTNLLISNIELRTDDSPDIQPYTHERLVEKVVVPLGDELASARDKYLCFIDIVVTRLKRASVLYNRDLKSLSKFLILKARDAFRQNPPSNLSRAHYGSVEGDFAMAMSLYHGYELLQRHGLRSLYNFLEGLVAPANKSTARARSELLHNEDFVLFLDSLRAKYKPVK